MQDFTPGPHLLIDHRGGLGMTDPALLETTLRAAAEAAGATALSATMHEVEDGVSGALLLVEGHIAVRTWASQTYASFDVFIPGEGLGKKAADHLARALLPDWTQIHGHMRNDFTAPPPATS